MLLYDKQTETIVIEDYSYKPKYIKNLERRLIKINPMFAIFRHENSYKIVTNKGKFVNLIGKVVIHL